MLDIYLASIESGGGGARELARLAALDPESGHSVTEDPDVADAVLLTNVTFDGRLARALLLDPFLRRVRDRLFLHSESDVPWRILPGVYASMPRARLDRWTARPIGYACWGGGLNPEVLRRARRPRVERAPDLLYSFVGKVSHSVRRRLFALAHDPANTVVRNTSGRYRHQPEPFPGQREAQLEYVEVALRSRFALCPRGWGTSSFRLYEMLALGIAPVILADRWVPPTGPDWERFALFVGERDVDRIPDVLASASDRWREMGLAARAAWDDHFRPARQFRTVAEALASLLPEADRGRRRLEALWPLSLPAMSSWRTAYLLSEKVRRWGGPF